METSHIFKQRLLGGHPAVDFVNSAWGEGIDQPFECLRDYRDLVAWAVHAQLLPRSGAEGLLREARRRPTEAAATLRRALEFRGHLDAVLRALAHGSRPAGTRLDALREPHRDALAHARLRAGAHGLEWTWHERDDLGRPLWPVVLSAVELVTSGAVDRLKQCSNCPWLFIDATKNRSRRWCTMEAGCGEAVKMRRYVERRAARRRAGRARTTS